MALIAGIIAGGATLLGGLAGDATSAIGTQDTNATNAAINNATQQAAMDRQLNSQGFNADQAAIARQFSAQQVQQQEQFQMQTQQQAEAWDEQMSNTAMQRRVADLQAAGLNPMLAASAGGASAPVQSGLTGSVASAAQASGSPAGAPGPIAMQNPSAAFGNLGGTLSNATEAAKTGAQVDLLKAQTDKLNAESNQEIPAQVDYIKSMTGLTDRNAEQAYYNTQKIQEQIYGERLSNDQLRDLTTPMASQNLEILKATRDALISAQQSDATAKALGLQKLRNLNDIQSSQLGQVINWANAILEPVGSAAGIASKLAN